MRVGNTLPEVGTVFDWDISEIMERPSLDSEYYGGWEETLTAKRQDFHYKDVMSSLKQWGFIRPLTASRETGELRLGDGHHRLAAAIELGMTTVPVEVHEIALVASDSGGWHMVVGIEAVKQVTLEEVFF